jgi:hypothetical protein
VALAALATLLLVNWHSAPPFEVIPVPRNAPTLNQADVEKILGAEQFRLIQRKRQVPLPVQQSFTNLTGFPFAMADPGEPMSSDNMSSGAPLRRLVFVALGNDSAVLVYEQGGFVDVTNVIVFWYGGGGRDWAATLGNKAKNIRSLRSTMKEGQFSAFTFSN